MYGDDIEKRRDTATVLVYVLDKILKLLHPIIPFVTERIYSELPTSGESIMISEWPKPVKKYAYFKEATQMEGVMAIIRAVRNIKAEAGASPSKRLDIFAITENPKLIKKCASYVEKLANVSSIKFINREELPGKVSGAVTPIAEIYIPLGDLVDLDKEIEKVKNEIDKMRSEVKRGEGMLNNAGFVARAPQAVVENERQKLAANLDKLAKLQKRLEDLENN